MPGGGCRAVVAASSQTAAKAAKKRKEAAAEKKKRAKADSGDGDEEAPPAEPEEEEEQPKSCPRRSVGKVLDFLDQTWLQAIQYIIFLFTFQSLTNSMRKPEEFYLDKYVTCLLYTSPSPRDRQKSRMPSSA